LAVVEAVDVRPDANCALDGCAKPHLVLEGAADRSSVRAEAM